MVAGFRKGLTFPATGPSHQQACLLGGSLRPACFLPGSLDLRAPFANSSPIETTHLISYISCCVFKTAEIRDSPSSASSWFPPHPSIWLVNPQSCLTSSVIATAVGVHFSHHSFSQSLCLFRAVIKSSSSLVLLALRSYTCNTVDQSNVTEVSLRFHCYCTNCSSHWVREMYNTTIQWVRTGISKMCSNKVFLKKSCLRLRQHLFHVVLSSAWLCLSFMALHQVSLLPPLHRSAIWLFITSHYSPHHDYMCFTTSLNACVCNP